MENMIFWHAGTQYRIQILLDTLTGTDFHLVYTGYLTQLGQMDDNGLLRHDPFKILNTLRDLVWAKCMLILKAHTTGETSERVSLQDLIQPPSIHITIAKSVSSDDGIIAKVVGDDTNNFTGTLRTLQIAAATLSTVTALERRRSQ